MKISYCPKGENRVEVEAEAWPNIVIDGTDQQGRMPSTVCNVEVTSPERGAKSARFFVTVGIDENGRPWASVTGLKPNTDTTKRVSASWLDFRARAEAKIGGGQ